MTELEKVYFIYEVFVKKYCDQNAYDFQKQIAKAIIRHGLAGDGEKIAIEVSRQCVAENAYITLANGNIRKIRDCDLNDRIISLDGDVCVITTVKDKWFSGLKKCYEVVTGKGKKIVVTEDHKFLTPQGFLSIKEGLDKQSKIRFNDHKNNPKGLVGLNNGGRFAKCGTVGIEKAKILGYFLADGHCGKRQTPKFTNISDKYKDDFECLIKSSFNGLKVKRYNKGNGQDLVVSSESHTTGDNEFINWLRKIGLYGKSNNQKIVPDLVFNFSEIELSNFLNRLYSSDGWVVTQVNSRNTEIGVAAHSYHYAMQIQSLLSKLGILSYINISNGKKNKKNFYKVRVSDKISVKKFFKKIGFIYGKEKKSKKSYSYVCSLNSKKAVGVHKKDLFYDYVKGIKPVGYRKTYDLSINKFDNFVCNGFVVHNSGKTTAVVDAVAFLLCLAPKLIDKALRIGIFAPQREQAKTDFDRLKVLLDRVAQDEGVQTEERNAQTLKLSNGSEAYIFPVTATSHPESKTLDLMIFEESQSIDDWQMMNAIWPMGSATNSPHIYIGTAGYQICYFYRALHNKAIQKYIYPYDKIIEQKQRVFEEDGNEQHLKYKQYIDKQIEEMGAESDEFRAPYKLEWIIGRGQFVTEADLYILRDGVIIPESDEEATAGIDTAKDPDSTVVTVKLLKSSRIANWLILKGDNYEDQFHAICSFLKNFKNIRKIAIDATGQGDFMPDLFENNTSYPIERVKFSLPTKDIMYKNLIGVIRNKLTKYPNADTAEVKRFEQEMLDLQKEYKGELLSCHHPDSADARDDMADSWCLAEYAHKLLIEEGEPSIEII